jgi:hypothetical protein
MPDRGTIHVNTPLSNVAAGYKNAEHIWNRIMPAVPVEKETDTFYKFGQEFLRYYGKTRANGAPAERITSYSGSTDTYQCKEHAYKDIVTDRDRNLADPIVDPDKRVTNNLTKIVDLDIEVDASSALFNSSNFTGMYTTPSALWNADVVNGDPIGDIDGAKTLVQKEIGVEPNVLVLGKQVFDELKRHPDLLDYFKHTGVPILTEQMLANVFGISEVVVGKAIHITSKPGQSTVTKDYVWGNYASLLYRTPNPAMEEPSWGYTFMHKLFGGVTAKTKKWRAEDNDGDMIEVARSYVQKVTGLKAGYLFVSPITL